MMAKAQQLGEEARRFLPLSEATYLILLALHEPNHGYGIMQAVAATAAGNVKLGPGTLYGALTNLLKQGLIVRTGEEPEAQDRRKQYTLTPLGRAVVELECKRLGSMARIGERVLERQGTR